MANLYIGTSGFTYKNWRGKFYPKGVAQKNWLEFYAKQYNAVEINASFYRTFPEHVVQHWHDVTPPNFRFVLKAPRVITHEKVLDDVGVDLGEFTASALGLREKFGAALWQFSASTHAEPLRERFERFLSILPSEIQHVFEFRHRSWFNPETFDLLNKYRAGFVVNDTPRLPTREAVTCDIVYMRFHGPGEMYRSLYTPEQLRKWADKIRPQLDGHDVYLFFNNTMTGNALQNACEMRELLTGS